MQLYYLVMADAVPVNGVTDINGKNGYYGLNGDGDTDSMPPGNDVDSQNRKYLDFF